MLYWFLLAQSLGKQVYAGGSGDATHRGQPPRAQSRAEQGREQMIWCQMGYNQHRRKHFTCKNEREKIQITDRAMHFSISLSNSVMLHFMWKDVIFVTASTHWSRYMWSSNTKHTSCLLNIYCLPPMYKAWSGWSAILHHQEGIGLTCKVKSVSSVRTVTLC